MQTARISLLFVTSILLFGCASPSEKSVEVPPDTDLTFFITEEYSEEKIKSSGATYLPGWFGASEYLDGKYEAIVKNAGNFVNISIPDVHVTYLFCGYPDLSDSQKVTRIEITDPEIRVFGLTMNSEKEEIAKRMDELGYSCIDKDRNVYSFDKCTYTFSKSNIFISAPESTNKNNIVY